LRRRPRDIQDPSAGSGTDIHRSRTHHNEDTMAIDDLLDEHEQSERVRKWLRENALGLIGGVGLGLGAVYGYFWWTDRQDADRIKASDQYQAVVQELKASKLKEAQAKTGELKDTAFAALVALDIAKSQLDIGKRDDAIATLRAVKTTDSMVAPIVEQRLARLLIDAGKHQEALDLLKSGDDASSHEVRGDALFALGRKDQARDAYNKALGLLDVAAPQRRLLELKLTQAGGTPPKPATAS
jgi:predicted negative regulator of RcsB-dependent stress response